MSSALLLWSSRKWMTASNPQEMPGEASSYLPPDAKVFGRDDVRELILRMILDSTEDDEASAESSSAGAKRGTRARDHGTNVLPIAGMSGVGKATLAQVIYNHQDVKKHFPQRAWVYVSEHFSSKRTLQEILRSLQGNDSSLNNEDSLVTVVSKLREAINQRERLFLVLDNVWDNIFKYWQDLLDAIVVTEVRGSVVLVTTQSQNVARYLGTMCTIVLSTLPWDSFWPLLQYHAFGTMQADQDNNQGLLGVAQQIAKKLDGSPLAAKVIGYLLRSRVDEDKWGRIAESDWWRVDEVVKDILPYLRVSYQHLSPRQRQCFAYCSIFPQNYLFDRDRLVQMWMAHDFIEHSKGDGRRLEDVGRDWFDELVARSLFQPTFDKNKYVMHDLVRALAIAVSTNQCFVHRICSESSAATPTIRHLALQPDTAGENFADLHKYKNLRTLLIFANIESYALFTCLDKMLENSRCLRVLDLSYVEAQGKEWPKAGSMRKLQFLDLSFTRIQKLRDFPCSLQVLHLRGYGSGSLPQSIVKLSELRHLYVDALALSFISSIGKLTKIVELEIFSARKGKGFMINELKNLQELRGQLCIRGIHNVRSKEAMEARLIDKKHLKRSVLEGTRAPKIVLEGLQPHPSIQELKIGGYGGTEMPNWVMQSTAGLANLLRVELSKCHLLVDLPPFGSLPCLKFLSLEILSSVKSVDGSSFGDFPSLEELKVSHMDAWEEWSEPVGPGGENDGDHGQQFLPHIKGLHLTCCSSLKEVPRLSSLSMLSELEISKCGEYVKRQPSCEGVLASLRTLKISYCDHRVSISVHQLKSLENLELMDCKGLRLTDRFRCFTYLRTAKVLSCPELFSEICGDQEEERLHEEHCAHLLTNLFTDKSLMTGNYIRTLGRLPSLRELHIYDMDNHQAFSGGQMEAWFQHLTSLKSLWFAYCRALERIPATIGGISSMRKLGIDGCDNIQSVLADVLPRGLDSFIFAASGHLAPRINSHQAVDWPNIAHVPYIRVNGEVIQNIVNK